MPFRSLVSPESLRAADEPYVLLDARPGAESFASGHLPEALHAEIETALSAAAAPGFDPARGGRHPLPACARWAAQLAAWGIGPDTPVVVYDAASGANAACRAWWMLRAAGHRSVAVLDGGLPAALASGFALSRGEARTPAAAQSRFPRSSSPCARGACQRP